MGNLMTDNLLDSIGESAKGTILRSMAIFTTIELCGSFITGKTGPKTTRSNFTTFCKSKYMPMQYHKISRLLYSIFRNGVAHSYVPKGSAYLTSDTRAAGFHLRFFHEGICIYVPTLAEDVGNAIKSLVSDLKQSIKLKTNYLTVFQKLDRIGKKEYQKFIQDNNITTIPGKFRGDINIGLE